MAEPPTSKRPKNEADLTDSQREAIFAMKLVDLEENPLAIDTADPLSSERRTYYAQTVPDFPGPADERVLASVHCSNEESKVEHIVVLNPSPPHDPTPFLQDDKIMFEEVPLSSLIQYRFSADSPWLLAPISVESLVFYRSSKFEIWKDMLMKGGNGCLRAFKSMLRTGLITDIYDPVCLPSPPEEADAWKVEDPKKPGTFVDIPRPVHELRVWDAASRGHVNVDSRMEGAPAAGEEEKYWNDLLVQLREFHGADTVDSAFTE